MPNGGSDCCGTCWFNAKNKGEAGYGHSSDPETARCVIRDVEIADPFWTYCANHPHHNPDKLKTPIGPIYVNHEGRGREFWRPPPDSPEIREKLLELLAAIPEKPRPEYPTPTRFEHEIIRQLGVSNERRALPGLRRLLGFKPGSKTFVLEGAPPQELVVAGGPWFFQRQETIGLALEAIARIEEEKALADIEPFVTAGLSGKMDQPLEDAEKLASLRAMAVACLIYCGDAAKPLLRAAAADPVEGVAELAKRLLKE